MIATVDTYDASARALANGRGSDCGFGRVPEKLRKTSSPQPLRTRNSALQWVFANASSFNGQATRVAVAGESAGGNLAAVVCMMARDRSGKMPVHQALILPRHQSCIGKPVLRGKWQSSVSYPARSSVVRRILLAKYDGRAKPLCISVAGRCARLAAGNCNHCRIRSSARMTERLTPTSFDRTESP